MKLTGLITRRLLKLSSFKRGRANAAPYNFGVTDMTGEIILAGTAALSGLTCTLYVFIGWLFGRNKPAGTFEGGLSQTEFAQLMQAKHGDNWQAMLEAWQLGDE